MRAAPRPRATPRPARWTSSFGISHHSAEEESCGPRTTIRPDPQRRTCLERDLALDQERDNRHEQRDAFDQRGRDDHRRLDAGAVVRLAGHALGVRTTDAADADAGAEHRETAGQAGADETVAL